MEVYDVANVEDIIDQLMNRACQITDILDRERQLATGDINQMGRRSTVCTGRSTTAASRMTTITEIAPTRPVATKQDKYSRNSQIQTADVSCDSSVLCLSGPIQSLNSSITRSLSQDSVVKSKSQAPSVCMRGTSKTNLSVMKKAKDNEFYFPSPQQENRNYGSVVTQYDGYKDYPIAVTNEQGTYTGTAKVRISRLSHSAWLHIHFVIMSNIGDVILDLKAELLGEETRNVIVNGVLESP